ncbi:MAG: hypothetical protein QOI06_1875 [Nocardioidaceae bacterium]|nr:hypothetical protein [Nocardioidaceae bacterium]
MAADRRVPAWVPATSLVLCVAGVAVAGYLTYEHYSASTTLSCPSTGTIDCLKVTTSTYSKVFGIPVALLGLLYFIAITPLCLPVAWRSPVNAVHGLRAVASLAGVAFVCYLVWAELFRIDAICLWCTGVHIITVLLFFVVCFGTALLGSPDASDMAVLDIKEPEHGSRP